MKREPHILVVDDDDSTRRYLAALLESLGYDSECVDSGEQALAHLAAGARPAAVLLDLLMPGMSGLDTLDRIRHLHPGIPVIVLSTMAQISTVVDAVRRGACDYLNKGFPHEELERVLRKVVEHGQGQRPRPEASAPRRSLDREDGLVSANPHILRIKAIGRQVADTDAPVLILGPSGVGKEVVARFIHGQSRRRGHSFVKVNCAALPEDLLESELFGHERGAFSGALRQKPGLFEQADGGTILLDEIGEMTFHLQAKLLHVLQDGEYTRLGGQQPVRVDARVMASTNVCLDEAVAAGRFRQDLFFRLNVIRIAVPTLKERGEDIPLLCAHFVRRYAARYSRAIRQLPPELLKAFLRHDWPGNVRELENAVRRYVILEDLEGSLAELRRGGSRPPSPSRVPAEPLPEKMDMPPEAGVSLRTVSARAAEEAERKVLGHVLAQTRWNRREAAAQLKISYKALLNKIKKWEVDEPLANPRGDDDGRHGQPRRPKTYPFPGASAARRQGEVEPLPVHDDDPVDGLTEGTLRPASAWRQPAVR